MIPYGRQSISEEDIASVVSVLQSDWLTQGPLIEKFETEFSQYVDVKYAVSANSATSALHMACLALDVTIGDHVWTSANSFVASSNCALYCGAEVAFVDIDPDTFNMCPVALEDKLKLAETKKQLPKVVIPVHFSGQVCEMDKIFELSKKYGFKIIEDASHAVGAQYKQQNVGACEFSDITVFSFHPVKIMTTVEGGMAFTKDKELSERLKLFRSHGIANNTEDFQGESLGVWHKEQSVLGFNYRLNDVQCALGLSQLSRLDEFVSKRREKAKYYDEILKDLPLRTPVQNSEQSSSWHLYVIQLDTDSISKTREQVFNELRERGVGVQIHYVPIYKQYFYVKKYGEQSLKNTEAYYSKTITLPLYYNLNQDKQDTVFQALKEVLV